MSSSLARSRSLRKPTDLSSSSTAPQRNVSPSRLPAPRPTRPTTRNVSSGSLNDTAAAAAPKKKPSALSSLLSRGSSTRQTAARKDASSSSTTAPSSRTANAPTRTSSTREPTAGLNRLRNPAASSTSNLPGTSGSGSGSGSTRPTTSSGLAQKRTTPTSSTGPGLGHTRARSVATLNGSTTLPPPNQSSTTSRSTAPKPRPTSLYGAPSTSTTSLASSTAAARRPGSAAAQDPARPPRPGSGSSTSTTSTATASTTNLTHKPSVASISTRTRAGSTASTKPPSKPPTRQQTTPTSPRHPKPPVRQQQQQTSQPASPRSPRSPPRNKPLLKPAFTTLQQHYSPAKNLAPKPLTATYLAPPSPSKLPTNVALSAETSRLQTELLQLHVLHRDLPTTTSQWHASARSHLASLHAALASSSKDLVSLEADAAERLNVAALHRWATPRKGLLEEKIQRLDALLTSLWSLDSPGGKHNRLVRAFERWASSLSDLEAARARADGPDSDPAALLDANLEVRFGGGLDARWKEECALLVRRLEGWDLQLKELAYDGEEEEEAEDVAQTSSLKRMLDGCESLIKDMLGELAVMEEIEAAAVQRETEWIKKMNRQGDDGGKRDTPRAGAVWRVI